MFENEVEQKESVSGRAGKDLALARIYLKVRRKDIAYLRFILESYDGIGFIRTVEADSSVVEYNYPPSQAGLAARLLAALTAELSLEEIDCPQGVSPI